MSRLLLTTLCLLLVPCTLAGPPRFVEDLPVDVRIGAASDSPIARSKCYCVPSLPSTKTCSLKTGEGGVELSSASADISPQLKKAIKRHLGEASKLRVAALDEVPLTCSEHLSKDEVVGHHGGEVLELVLALAAVEKVLERPLRAPEIAKTVRALVRRLPAPYLPMHTNASAVARLQRSLKVENLDLLSPPVDLQPRILRLMAEDPSVHGCAAIRTLIAQAGSSNPAFSELRKPLVVRVLAELYRILWDENEEELRRKLRLDVYPTDLRAEIGALEAKDYREVGVVAAAGNDAEDNDEGVSSGSSSSSSASSSSPAAGILPFGRFEAVMVPPRERLDRRAQLQDPRRLALEAKYPFLKSDLDKRRWEMRITRQDDGKKVWRPMPEADGLGSVVTSSSSSSSSSPSASSSRVVIAPPPLALLDISVAPTCFDKDRVALVPAFLPGINSSFVVSHTSQVIAKRRRAVSTALGTIFKTEAADIAANMKEDGDKWSKAIEEEVSLQWQVEPEEKSTATMTKPAAATSTPSPGALEKASDKNNKQKDDGKKKEKKKQPLPKIKVMLT